LFGSIGSFVDLLHCSFVCQSWKKMCESPVLWQKLAAKRQLKWTPKVAEELKSMKLSWKLWTYLESHWIHPDAVKNLSANTMTKVCLQKVHTFSRDTQQPLHTLQFDEEKIVYGGPKYYCL